MAMASSTANWHWKTKYVSGWAKEWFTSELAGVSQTEGNDTVTVERVTEVEGDVELGRRKSKLITIYDCRVVLDWSAAGADEASVRGTVVIPEVSHENTLDGVSDYTYEWKITTSSGDSSVINNLMAQVKKILPALLEAKFKEFPKALLDTHGKDLVVVTEDNTPSGSGTVTPSTGGAQPIAGSKTTASKGLPGVSKGGQAAVILNTSTVKVESRFMASAEDLFGLLTDESRIPMWSRAPAQSKPVPGSPFSLFSGGVVGEYVEVESPKKVVQKWRLTGGSGWADSHYATLTILFTQESDSTNVELVLDGVPKGKEEEVERGLEGYYIRGLKSIGYVEVSHYVPTPQRSTTSSTRPQMIQDNRADWKGYIAVAVACLVLSLSVMPVLTWKNATNH
ncbi:hypothetical protein CPB86DRAFT_819435 [Serendipita vermifera]|nr:hypothetical protein CPB86DRAFT_819435 [Serendipita vermifera]